MTTCTGSTPASRLEYGARDIARRRTQRRRGLTLSNRHDLSLEDAFVEQVHALHDDRFQNMLAANDSRDADHEDAPACA